MAMSNGSVSAGCTNGNTNGKSEWPIPPYSRPKFTSTDLDWAPLSQFIQIRIRSKVPDLRSPVTIDISNFEKPERRRELAKELESAVNEVGFFVVVGHGITDEEVLRQLAIANAFFHLPMEEKVKVPIDLENYHKFSFQINDPQSTHLIAYNSWGYREPKRKLGDSGYIEAVETVSPPKWSSRIQNLRFCKSMKFTRIYPSSLKYRFIHSLLLTGMKSGRLDERCTIESFGHCSF